MAELEVSFDVQSPSIDATFDLSQPSLEAVFEINTLVTPVALGELTDVTITNPENGQTLVYNATTQMWNNSSANEAVWGNITGTLSDQADLQNALNNKVTGNAPIVAKTATKITYDSKGLITGSTNLTAGDIPNLTLSKITDVSATASEVNVLDGVAISTTELNQLSGITGNVQAQINTEKANRISADNTLQANINAEASTRASADAAETNARIAEDIALSNRINAEASTRATADTALGERIDEEASTRATADTALGERIDEEVSTRTTQDTALSNRINAEASTRATADTALGERIDEEISTRITEDTALSNRINAEASTRATEDTALGERIDEEVSTRITEDTSLSNRIDSEASTRATEDTSLSDRINAEVSTRTTQDTALSDRINAEASTRATEDTSLSERITANASSIATINTTISGYGDIVTHDQDEFATAAQGALADTALQPEDVVDNVVTTSTDLPLSANMGKELQDEIDNLKARGRFLALWNCATGLAESDPTTSPRPYNSGDYFIVGIIAAEGGTNYRPDGTQYVIGQASTTVETAVVQVDDVYYYDGTTWKLQVNTRKTVTFAQIAGQPTDNTNLAAALNNKVTKNNDITAGTHSKITYDSKGLVTGGSDLTLSDLGVTASATELNYTDGVTSNIQTQLDTKLQYDTVTSDGIYLATHPERNIDSVIIPFIHNDLAYFTKKGGTCTVTIDGVENTNNILNLFDGTPSYWGYTSSTTLTDSTVIVTMSNIATVKTIGFDSVVYVDFGTTNWKAKHVKIEYKLASSSDWVTLHETTTNTSTAVYQRLYSDNLTTNKLTDLRFTFSDFTNSTIFRIAEIGLINYNSAGAQNTLLGLGGGTMYGDILPATSGTYNLGSLTNVFANIYTDSATIKYLPAQNSSYPNRGTLIPFAVNDMAYLTKRGGTVTLTVDGTEMAISNPEYLFNGRPNGWDYTITGVTELVLTVSGINTVGSFTYYSTVYVDFWDYTYKAKDVKIEYKKVGDTDWTTALDVSNDTSTKQYQSTNFTTTSARLSDLRLTFKNFQSSSRLRIAQIGLLSNQGLGYQGTLLSLNGGTMYGSVNPYATDTYNLGTSSKRWSIIYSKYLAGVENIVTNKINSVSASNYITTSNSISDLIDDTATNPVDKADTLTDLTATITELNYTDGVTSNIQTQLNGKQNTLSEGTGIDITNDTVSTNNIVWRQW